MLELYRAQRIVGTIRRESHAEDVIVLATFHAWWSSSPGFLVIEGHWTAGDLGEYPLVDELLEASRHASMELALREAVDSAELWMAQVAASVDALNILVAGGGLVLPNAEAAPS